MAKIFLVVLMVLSLQHFDHRVVIDRDLDAAGSFIVGLLVGDLMYALWVCC